MVLRRVARFGSGFQVATSPARLPSHSPDFAALSAPDRAPRHLSPLHAGTRSSGGQVGHAAQVEHKGARLVENGGLSAVKGDDPLGQGSCSGLAGGVGGHHAMAFPRPPPQACRRHGEGPDATELPVREGAPDEIPLLKRRHVIPAGHGRAVPRTARCARHTRRRPHPRHASGGAAHAVTGRQWPGR